MATRAVSTIRWLDFTLEGQDGESWSTEYEHGYIGVSLDNEGPPQLWSAVIECGELVSEGTGASAHEALYIALWLSAHAPSPVTIAMKDSP